MQLWFATITKYTCKTCIFKNKIIYYSYLYYYDNIPKMNNILQNAFNGGFSDFIDALPCI